MASLGKINNSLTSLTNENTLALVNINFDVSLLRDISLHHCEPAQEFIPVGSALTAQRKLEAENGRLHKTACRLGFLFHDSLPDITKLYKAYGVRVSEILARPDINPQGTDDDGPFRTFIRADCTSIWAAATSNTNFVGIHLLACMLARAWDAKKAVSIWSELVQEKRAQIQISLDEQKIVSPYSAAALHQDISRADLASWDASARAWLRRADQSMAVQKTQWSLIIDNIKVPYTTTGSTFDRVIHAWVQAMRVVERLLNNLPQQVCDRAILLAVSSWHLFPNLVVFRETTTDVSFKDALFPSSGILSVGLEYKGEAGDGFSKWSLALSHLRCYGDPVQVKSNETMGRVQFSKLWLLALGTIFRQWSVSYSHFNTSVAWFEELGRLLHRSPAANCTQLSWLLRLCDAASQLGESKETEGFALIKYGWRRGVNFLGNNKIMQPPFFGLCNAPTMDALSQDTDTDCGIAYLRRIANELDLEVCDTLISCVTMRKDVPYYEWATITPSTAGMSLGESNESSSLRCTRWIYCLGKDLSSECEQVLHARSLEIEAKGEHCIILRSTDKVPGPGFHMDMYWEDPPVIFHDPSSPPQFTPFPHRRQGNNKFTLWLRRNKYAMKARVYESTLESAGDAVCSITSGLEWLRTGPPASSVSDYLLEFLDVSLKPSHGRIST
jgi:hypothetical protein